MKLVVFKSSNDTSAFPMWSLFTQSCLEKSWLSIGSQFAKFFIEKEIWNYLTGQINLIFLSVKQNYDHGQKNDDEISL